MFKTKGIVTYNPKRSVSSDWWLTIELPYFEQTAAYYRWMIDRNWWEADSSPVKRKYSRLSHAPHVSVIRGEKIKENITDWGKYLNKKKVDVLYDYRVRQTTIEKDGKDHFWFLDAYVDCFCDLRKHFGLDYQRDGIPFKGHITIARVH